MTSLRLHMAQLAVVYSSLFTVLGAVSYGILLHFALISVLSGISCVT